MDTPEDAKRMADLAGATFAVLSDAGKRVATSYAVYDRLGDGVAAPSTFIVARDGELVAGHVGNDIADRVPPDAIIATLRELKAAKRAA